MPKALATSRGKVMDKPVAGLARAGLAPSARSARSGWGGGEIERGTADPGVSLGRGVGVFIGLKSATRPLRRTAGGDGQPSLAVAGRDQTRLWTPSMTTGAGFNASEKRDRQPTDGSL
ncbi:MAG: hypothetical protein B7Y81_00615 [Caulobacter sp. 32-67-35]|nr:MAG: hypothetical protein B7Y81_00615 [Caulobacter sp. 32-67-35]